MYIKASRLTDGLDSNQVEQLGDLNLLEASLNCDRVPEVGEAEKVSLLEKIQPYINTPAGRVPLTDTWLSPQPLRRGLRQWWQLIMSQIILVERSFWLSSGLVFGLGFLVALLDTRGLMPLLFVLLSPVIAAVTVSYVFRPKSGTLLVLEKIAPTHPLELLYARLILVLGFNTLISMLLLLVICMRGSQVVVWRMLFAWLGPMLALSGASLYFTTLWGLVAGTALPLIAWSSLVLLGWERALAKVASLQLAVSWLMQQVNGSDLLLAVYLAALVFGLFMLQQSGRLAVNRSYRWS